MSLSSNYTEKELISSNKNAPISKDTFFPLQGFLVRIKMALKWHRSPVNNMRNLKSNSYMKIDDSF